MRYVYDVVVVGAGNGGLSAASKLAQAGLKVIMLEKHNLPGGVATSFVRGRFEFEASLHELCDVGTEEQPLAVRNIFKGLGVDAPMVNEKNLFRAIVTGEDGYDVTLKAGEALFEESLEAACPGSGKSIKKLKDLLAKTREALAYNDRMNGRPNKLVMIFKYSKFLIAASHSVDEVLRSLGFSKKARSVLETYWLYLGVPADELNAFHYFQMLRGYIDSGAGVPEHKSYGLSLGLAESVLKNGGEIRYNTEVDRFLYDDDKRVIGVAAGGDEYYAKQVVSNVIPHNVFNMSERRNTAEKDRKLLNARRFGLSFVCLYVGLDRSAEELGIKDYTVFVAKKDSSRTQYDDDADLGVYVVNCLNVAVPDATPAGTCSMFFSIPVFSDKLMNGVEPENYKQFKSEIAKRYIADYEQVTGIRISDCIEEISVATPVTFARYFGSPNGTAYGYRLSRWDGLMARILSAADEFKIKGLTFCGGHTASGDGFGVSYASGLEAADRVLALLKEEGV